MAIVLFIIGMLIAGLVGPVAVQLEAAKRKETLVSMATISDALYGYALTNGRLPCPDTTGNGIPDPDPYDATNLGLYADAVCTNNVGWLPWNEIGFGQSGDAWGNRFLYAVRGTQYTWAAQNAACDGDVVDNDGDLAPAGIAENDGEFDLCATGNFEVSSRGDDSGTAGVIEGKAVITSPNNGANVVGLILSHGKNSYGATSVEGIARPAVPISNLDEIENTDGDRFFFDRIYSVDQTGCADDADETAPLCEFDDLVLRISRTVLNGRMVQAGQLP